MRKGKGLWIVATCAAVAVLSARLAAAADRIVEEKDPSGKVQLRYSVGADGVKNGFYQSFFENGKLKELANYVRGELDGPFQENHANMQPALKCSYRKGLLDGTWTAFDEQGRKSSTGEYADGKKNGFFREYKLNQIASEQFYINDALILPRSAAMINVALAEIRGTKVKTAAVDPAAPAIPKHRGEKQSQEDREAGVRVLMEYRYLCNVPFDIALDPVYNAHDEAAAELLVAVGKLDHHPANVGWPEEEYRFAEKGTGSSNLFEGAPSAATAVNAFMNDSDPSNIDRLGHRRWCLNPGMAKTGFGSAGRFVAMWSFDNSRQPVPDYDYVAYPAAGLFPNSHFAADAAWSVSLNPEKYQAPDEKTVKVSVKPARISTSPPGLRAGPELKLNYFHVDTQGFGINNAIMFRFDKCSTQSGAAYVIEITGLETAAGNPATLKYVVAFFTPQK